MAFQSLMTKPSKPMRPLRTPLIMSPRACIFTAPLPSPAMSREEYDGMTVPTPRSTAVRNGARWMSSSSSRVTLVTPWSMVYFPVVEEPYAVPPSPTKCLAVASTLSSRFRSLPFARPWRPWITVSMD